VCWTNWLRRKEKRKAKGRRKLKDDWESGPCRKVRGKTNKRETKQRLLRSGLHPHPGPSCNFDDPEAFDDFDGEARRAALLRDMYQRSLKDIADVVPGEEMVAIANADVPE
jgi:hypothetical protein